jgi:hypothetical protein
MFTVDRPTRGRDIAILVHRGIDHYAVPVSSLQNLEATAIHLVLATRPVKLLAACLSPTWPLIESDLTECLSEGFSVFMTGDLNAKHTDWNSRLVTARGSLLRESQHKVLLDLWAGFPNHGSLHTQFKPRRPS